MKKRMLRMAVLLTVLLACGATQVFAQMITKFAVVDTAKVYQAYFRRSLPVRNYDGKKQEFQDEINRLSQELQQLYDRRQEYERAGDIDNATRLRSEIAQKTTYLNEYIAAKNAELNSLKDSLQNDDEFYQKLYATLERVAESGGYSLVLSLQQANAVLWYSSSVDITDEVIRQLGL